MPDDNLIPAVAYELQPGKVYLLEVDKDKVSREVLERLAMHCEERLKITLLVVRTRGGGGIRMVPPPQEAPDGQ